MVFVKNCVLQLPRNELRKETILPAPVYKVTPTPREEGGGRACISTWTSPSSLTRSKEHMPQCQGSLGSLGWVPFSMESHREQRL